jgi:hypothetical protein
MSAAELTVLTGDICVVVEKPDVDWWVVQKSDGTEGFVPANFVALL